MKASNQIRYWRDSQIKGIEVCGVFQSSHIFPRHSHEDIYAISYMESGGSYWDGNARKSSLVTPGDLAVINPGQLHSGEPLKNQSSTYRMLYLKCALFNNKELLPQFKNVINNDPVLPRLFEEVYLAFTGHSEQLEKESLLTSFIGKMMEDYSFPNFKPERIGREADAIKKALDFLSQDLGEKVILNQLSEITGFSPYHFLRLFKKNTGVSPHHYRTQKRIEMAKKLLVEGQIFSEVALATGFTDQSHLTHTFKSYTGATPGQYILNK
jgi:AraC-like DNA-binding protein